ncbi:PaaI family thioesterase [uncultured Dysosmobacter sp.]|uniref:PaaI family thioesterase n=1 Tax=uncultured Dysosmobacter sp. TaxID=2591384 RepID=UPI00262ED26A|nr:PaaI family thioesterase [uncultured Dysosmobacter sp.]
MDFQKLVDYRNTHGAFYQRLGIVIQEISAGYARVTKTVTKDDLNPLNVPHGGLYFTMADTACGAAMSSHGYLAVTVNASYSFFRSAAVGDTLTAEAREVKTGKTLCVYDARITDQKGTLLGTGTFTFYMLDQKLEI